MFFHTLKSRLSGLDQRKKNANPCEGFLFLPPDMRVFIRASSCSVRAVMSDYADENLVNKVKDKTEQKQTKTCCYWLMICWVASSMCHHIALSQSCCLILFLSCSGSVCLLWSLQPACSVSGPVCFPESFVSLNRLRRIDLC